MGKTKDTLKHKEKTHKSLHVDVNCHDLHLNPQCFHGPTLLFCRRGEKGADYYACSACRNRRECSFYQNVSDKSTKQSERAVIERQKVVGRMSYKGFSKLRKNLKKLPPERRGYCHRCNTLFDTESGDSHAFCPKILVLSDRQMSHPTEICLPKENNKVEAQYLFSTETARFVVDTVLALGAQRVLCIGTPRLHEIFINDQKIPSLLLDIDPKYHNFYSCRQFIWYNMFNHFTMDEGRHATLKKFLHTTDKIVVLLDPPFGGRVEPLAATLEKIHMEHRMPQDEGGQPVTQKRDMGVIWFFPYFMEHHIRDSLPLFRMLDYQVNYENHDSFSDHGPRRRKAGSPVRIFTNIPLSHFILSTVPGYKFCRICGHWVSESNLHCNKCNFCTSKNGMRYVHCNACGSCVKPSYEHCGTCQRCCLPTHVCGAFQPDSNCFHCHLPGHKRAHCPELQPSFRNKRKRVK